MNTFAIKEIEAVKGNQAFYKLLKNNTCFFDEFEIELLKTQHESEIPTILFVHGKNCKR